MTQEAPFQPTPLELVREDMAVQDEAGRRLGRVARVRLGDPQAATGQTTNTAGTAGVVVAPLASTGDGTAIGGGVPVLGGSEGMPDVPEPLSSELRRVGFIELKDSELDGAARYVPGDRITEVADDVVRVRRAPAGPGSVTSTSTEPVLRTTLGTPQQETAAPRERSRPVLKAGIGIGAGVGVACALAGGWVYWRRRQQKRHRLDRRVRRAADTFVTDLGEGRPAPLATSVGAAVLLLVSLARMRRDAGRDACERDAGRSEVRRAPAADATSRVQSKRTVRGRRAPVGVLLPLMGVSAGLVWLRARTLERPRYIGTPGVESALGRDLTRTGELPPDMGSEHPHH